MFVCGNSYNFQLNLFQGSSQIVYKLCYKINNQNVFTYHCHQDFNFNSGDIDWHHVALTYDYSKDKFGYFFDGIDGTIGSSNFPNFNPSLFFHIGVADYNSNKYKPFNGYMDEFRISSIIRYPDGSNFTPPSTEFTPDSNTIALWHFNQNNPLTTVIDNSGNGNNLNVSGNPKILNINNFILNTESPLIADSSFQSFQWYKCDNVSERSLTKLIGDTNHVFYPNTNGSYAVEIDALTCPIMSKCVEVHNVSIEKTVDNNFNIYPNPVRTTLNIISNNIFERIQIIDNKGNTIKEQSFNNNNCYLNLESILNGIYLLKIYNKKSVITKKLIILH